MKEKIIERIINYFEENESAFNNCIEELDGYNGYLADDRYYLMEEIDELYGGANPLEILERAYYGYDADTWHTDSRGNKEYGAFNPNRNYFKFNGYGNLVSTNYIDYSVHLDKYVIEDMSENRRYIYSIESDAELSELFDELEEETEE